MCFEESQKWAFQTLFLKRQYEQHWKYQNANLNYGKGSLKTFSYSEMNSSVFCACILQVGQKEIDIDKEAVTCSNICLSLVDAWKVPVMKS